MKDYRDNYRGMFNDPRLVAHDRYNISHPGLNCHEFEVTETGCSGCPRPELTAADFDIDDCTLDPSHQHHSHDDQPMWRSDAERAAERADYRAYTRGARCRHKEVNLMERPLRGDDANTTPLRHILWNYGVCPDDDSIDTCITEIVGLLNKHIPSITDEMDRDPDLFPKDDIGDYCGDQRECACGKQIDGYYDYVEHLKEMLA